MIAAAPFGDIVKQSGDIQQPGLRKIRDQLAAEWILVRMLGDGKAAHIAQHHQYVLIHRIHMEKIMLHLPDDAPERRQIASEYG